MTETKQDIQGIHLSLDKGPYDVRHPEKDTVVPGSRALPLAFEDASQSLWLPFTFTLFHQTNSHQGLNKYL